jgi:DNA-binding response OmpR family regulator
MSTVEARSDNVMNHRPHIVLVDADPRALARARRVLEGAGYEVDAFEGPGPRLARALHELPDLVLLELELPGAGGEALYRTFRDHPDLQGIPVVFYSAEDEGVLHRRALECGAAGWIHKGALAGELALAVARYLESAAAESRPLLIDLSPSYTSS